MDANKTSDRQPLVPEDVDLRDFPFMPVDIWRLFGSEFHARSNDGEWRAAMTLWLKSYHQVPAASIPDDDILLARLAEYAGDIKGWMKVRQGALRGWVMCSDGRLYHPVVAEKALEAWLEKLGQRKSSAAGNAKRHDLTFDPKPFDDAIDVSVRMLIALNPSSRFLSRKVPKVSRMSPDGSETGCPSGSQGKGREGKGRELSSHPSQALDSYNLAKCDDNPVLGLINGVSLAIVNGGRR